MWLLVVVILPVIGSVLFVLMAHRQLMAVNTAVAVQQTVVP